MNVIKVYNAEGVQVDSFTHSQSKGYIWRDNKTTSLARMLAILNAKGFYVRRQFSKSMKLQRSYVA